MAAKDVRDMTIRELNELAEQVRTLPIESKKYRQAADRMSMAAWALEGSGALGQLFWWAQEVAIEPPPDAMSHPMLLR